MAHHRPRPLREVSWTSTATRAIHQRSPDADAQAVLLLHGWPDSVLRFARLLPLLTDFHVVAPAIPGFPFATPVTGHGMSAGEMAGDVGCDVAEVLAARHPERASHRRLPAPLPVRAARRPVGHRTRLRPARA
jgi:hypothetical protein